MDIERLRALEKEIAVFSGDGIEGSKLERLATSWSEKLRGIIAELGQEVGAVEVPHPLGERHAAIEKALKGHTLLLMSRDHVNDQKKPLAEIKFGMSTDLGVLFCLADTEATMPVDASPAHTSEARDAARLDFMVYRGAVIDCSYNNDKRTVYRAMAFGQSLTGWKGSYREAIDAAMRQEGGTP